MWLRFLSFEFLNSSSLHANTVRMVLYSSTCLRLIQIKHSDFKQNMGTSLYTCVSCLLEMQPDRSPHSDSKSTSLPSAYGIVSLVCVDYSLSVRVRMFSRSGFMCIVWR